MPFDPSTLAQAGAAGVLSVVVALFVMGKLVSGTLLDRLFTINERQAVALAAANTTIASQNETIRILGGNPRVPPATT